MWNVEENSLQIIRLNYYSTKAYKYTCRKRENHRHWKENGCDVREWLNFVHNIRHHRFQQYRKLFTTVEEWFNLLTCLKCKSILCVCVLVCVCAYSIRSSLVVLSSCMLLTDTPFFIHHPSSPFTIISYLSANLFYKSQPTTLVCIHTAPICPPPPSSSPSSSSSYSMPLTCKLIDIYFIYIYWYPFFFSKLVISCLGWFFFQGDPFFVVDTTQQHQIHFICEHLKRGTPLQHSS